MRKKTVHKKRAVVSFKIHPRKIVFGFFAVVTLLLLNPLPAELSLKNVYEKIAHIVLPQKSEYLSDAYVDDILGQSGEFNDILTSTALFENEKVSQQASLPSSFTATVTEKESKKLADNGVLAAVDDSKWIEVDLSDQKLYAWENGNKVFEFTISSGKPWTPTVTGDYRIWIKLRYATMRGGSKEFGNYYYLPNVPYTMYFHKGYGIHGTYWHNNFGTPMSHGCVNMRTEEAGMLFNWVGPNLNGKSAVKATDDNPGTRVVVHE